MEIPVAPDEESVQAVRPPEMAMEIPVAPDEESVQAVRPPEMAMEIPVAPDEEIKRIQHLFTTGTWMPGADPLTIGPENFFAMQNLRFAERMLEGVPGYTKINTLALETYLKIRNGIQLNAPFTTRSRIFAQAYNDALSASQIIQNITAVPGTGGFNELMTLDVAPGGAGWSAGNTITGNSSGKTCVIVAVLTTLTYIVKDRSGAYTLGEILTNGTATADQGAAHPTFALSALHTDAAGAGLGRFARWPNNQIAYCNGVESKIYGGDEIPCAAFLTSSAAVTGATLTNPKDYSEQMRNNLQTSDQMATIGGGNDSYAKVLLTFESKDGAKIADTSVGGAGANDADLVGTADWSTDWAKFGTKSGKIPTTASGFSIADSADLDFGVADGTIDCWAKGGVYDYFMSGTYTYASATGRLTAGAWTTPFTNFAVGDIIACYIPAGAIWRFGNILSKAGDDSWVEVAGTFQDGDTSYGVKRGMALFGRYQDATHYWYVAAFPSFVCLAMNSGAGLTFTYLSIGSFSFASGAHFALVQLFGTALYFCFAGTRYSFGNIALPDLAAALTFGRCQWAAASYVPGFLTNFATYYDQIRVSKGVARWTTNFTPPASAYAAAAMTFLVGFTRPVQAVKLYIPSGGGNSEASSITGQEHNGYAWSLLTITDGTKPGTAAVAQTGSLSFASTVASSVAKLIEGRVLYWYQFALSAGEAQIYQVTGDAPWQDVRDVWDGSELLLSSCLVYVVATLSYKDFTLQAAENSPLTIVELDALATTEHLLLGSPVPLMGFNVRMSSDATKVNNNAAVMTLAYCDGSAITTWPAATSMTDGTSADGKSMKQSGTVSFTPVSSGQEFKVAINGGSPMYYYKITFSAALSASVESYYITGIPAPQTVKPYIFPFAFLGRPMLCGYKAGNEGNRVDYGMTAATDVWNGPDASMGVDSESLYFGGNEDLTAACEVYNRLGSSIYSFAIFCKEYEAYILNGYDAATYKIYPISAVYGCAGPLTMDTYQIGISKDSNSVRSIAMWLSHSGPVMFDSGGLVPVPGLECYFDRRDSRCINSAAIANARGWFDPDTGDYNLQIPSGVGQTFNNVWVALSMKHQKWYPVVPSAAASPYLGAAFRVSDTDGRQYVYGARDNGYMMRLHDPSVATWDGTGSVQSITLGDLLLSGNIWDRIRLRFLKLFGVSAAEDIDAAITHYADGAAAGTALADVALDATPRYFKSTQGLNLVAWSHQIKISVTVSTEIRGMRLLGWGMEFQVEREDLT
jgi:hypothetical protein